jgi:hypothetical protein
MSVHGARRGRYAAIATLAAAMMLSGAGSALAQVPPDRAVERKANGEPGKPIQVGVYLNVQPDCSSGTLPAIRLVSPPSNGTVNIKRGKVTATNYKQCLALEVPGFIAFYQSKPDFAGIDTVTLEVKYPQGRTETQRITINVGGRGAVPAVPGTSPAPAGQKI